MKLTDFQKLLVGEINNAKLESVNQFLAAHGNLTDVTYEGEYIQVPQFHTGALANGLRVSISQDSEKLFQDSLQFVSLLKGLANEGLIAIVRAPDNLATGITPVCVNYDGAAGPPDARLIAIFGEYAASIIYKLPRLDSFLKSGFRTEGERSVRRTIWLAILAALISGTIPSVVNLFHQRKVDVSHMPVIQDTISVRIVKPSSPPDSVVSPTSCRTKTEHRHLASRKESD